MQEPAAQLVPGGQAFPQLPQLLLSLVRLTHAAVPLELQNLSWGLGHMQVLLVHIVPAASMADYPLCS